jgi:hypothetical protein
MLKNFEDILLYEKNYSKLFKSFRSFTYNGLPGEQDVGLAIGSTLVVVHDADIDRVGH